MQKEGRKQFHSEYKKPVRVVPSFIGLTTDIYIRPPIDLITSVLTCPFDLALNHLPGYLTI